MVAVVVAIVEVVVVDVVVAVLSSLDGVRNGWQRLARSVPVPSIVQHRRCVRVIPGSLTYVLRQHVGNLIVRGSRGVPNVIGGVV